MWEDVLEPGLTLISGRRSHQIGFAQEVTHELLHDGRDKTVLWCDGDHGFDPYHFAELNLVRGRAADDGADRLLVKRCMTPFQWDSVLTQHLDQKLVEVDASVAIVAPFDRLWSTDELADWEAEDYVRYAVRHLKNLARRHRIPITVWVDMARWWHTHPVLAGLLHDAATSKWTLTAPGERWRLLRHDGKTVDPFLRRNVTLLDFMDEETVPLVVPAPRAEGSARSWSWRRKTYPVSA